MSKMGKKNKDSKEAEAKKVKQQLAALEEQVMTRRRRQDCSCAFPFPESGESRQSALSE